MADRSVLALDSSVIIAALQSWHVQHSAARASLDAALDSDDEILVPSRVLVECFSVMTRMPVPHRLAPSDALSVLEGTLEGSVRLVDLSPRRYWRFLRDVAGRAVSGGAVYDAEIVECSRRAGATRILTLNRSDFERLAPEGIRIVTPEDEANPPP